MKRLWSSYFDEVYLHDETNASRISVEKYRESYNNELELMVKVGNSSFSLFSFASTRSDSQLDEFTQPESLINSQCYRLVCAFQCHIAHAVPSLSLRFAACV